MTAAGSLLAGSQLSWSFLRIGVPPGDLLTTITSIILSLVVCVLLIDNKSERVQILRLCYVKIVDSVYM